MAQSAGNLYYEVDARTQGLLDAERQVDRSTKRMERGFNRTDKSVRRVNSSLGELKTIVTAVGGAMAVQRVVRYADAWTNLQNRLRMVTETEQERIRVTEKLRAASKDSWTGLSTTAVLYSRLSQSTTELNISESRLVRLTETINKSFAVSGATAQEAANAITQLSQGLASGTLRGEEFNSVSEQAPEILRAVARETGLAYGELREFAAEGGITAELLVSALENASDTIDQKFASAVKTFGNYMTEANDEVMEFVGTSQAVTSVVTASGETLVFLSKNIDDVARVAGLAATVIGVRLVQALNASIAKMAANAVGAASLSAAYSTMGARAATAAIASRTLAGAVGLLGGPVGVVVLAASALFTFREELGLVASQANTTRSRIDELTRSMAVMGEKAINSSIEAVSAELRFLEDQAWNTQQAINSLGDGETFGGQTKSQLEDQLESIAEDAVYARQELAELKRRKDELTENSNGGGGSSLAASNTKEKESADRLAEAYRNIRDEIRPLEKSQREYAQSKLTLIAYAVREKMDLIELGQLLNDLDKSYQNAGDAAEVYGFTGEAANKKINNSAQELGFTFSSAFEDAIVEGENLRSVMQGLYKDILRIVVRKSVTEPLGNAVAGFDWGGLFGFSSGGYTGDGGKYEPAGIVHKGEYVMPKSVVNEPGMLPLLERLKHTRGYASGGLVGSSSSGGSVAGNSGGIEVHIHNEGEKMEVQRTEQRQGPNMQKQIHVWVKSAVKGMMRSGEMDRIMGDNYGMSRRSR